MGFRTGKGLAWPAAFALLVLAAPVSAQRPLSAAPLAPELQTALRCGALFSIVAADQARGVPGSADWPPLAARGREFFVRISARVMDAAKLDRAGLQALVRQEVEALRRASPNPRSHAATLRAPCLAMLDAVVPPAR